MTTTEHADLPVRGAGRPVRTSSVVRAEWLKLWSVRSTVWSLVSLVVLGAGLTGIICATSAEAIASGEANESPGSFITWGMMIAQVTAVVLGVLVVSSEYGSGMIRTSAAATPKRGRVMFAKCAVLSTVLLLGGIVTAFAGYFAGNPFLEAEGVGLALGDDGVLRALVGGGLYLAVLGLFSAAIAFLLRHTAAAVSVSLAVVFVLGNLVLLIPGEVGEWITKLMPANAGGSVTMVVNFNPEALDPWVGFGVLCLETGVLLALAAVRFLRRDV